MLQVIHKGVVISQHRKYKNAKKRASKINDGRCFIVASDTPIERKRLLREQECLASYSRLDALYSEYNKCLFATKDEQKMATIKEEITELKEQIKEQEKEVALENWYN